MKNLKKKLNKFTNEGDKKCKEVDNLEHNYNAKELKQQVVNSYKFPKKYDLEINDLDYVKYYYAYGLVFLTKRSSIKDWEINVMIRDLHLRYFDYKKMGEKKEMEEQEKYVNTLDFIKQMEKYKNEEYIFITAHNNYWNESGTKLFKGDSDGSSPFSIQCYVYEKYKIIFAYEGEGKNRTFEYFMETIFTKAKKFLCENNNKEKISYQDAKCYVFPGNEYLKKDYIEIIASRIYGKERTKLSPLEHVIIKRIIEEECK